MKKTKIVDSVVFRLYATVLTSILVFTATSQAESSVERSLAEDDAKARFRFWAGVGPSSLIAADMNSYGQSLPGSASYGVTLSGGFNALLGEERRWIFDARAIMPLSDQWSPGYASSHLTRVGGLAGVGYRIVPHRLDLTGHGGLTYISGSNHDFIHKMGITAGLALSFQISGDRPHSLYQSIELSAFRIEETDGAATASLGISELVCYDNNGNDPRCSYGSVPATYVTTLMYRVGGLF